MVRLFDEVGFRAYDVRAIDYAYPSWEEQARLTRVLGGSTLATVAWVDGVTYETRLPHVDYKRSRVVKL